MKQKNFSLSKDQIQFYHDYGYLVVENVFSQKKCDEIVKIYEQHADENFSGIMNLDRKVEEIKNLVRDSRIVCILETLQNAPVSLLQTMFLFKKAGSAYASQAWNPHQDNAYPQARWGAYITGNIAFADQDPENGGMYIYPASHNYSKELLPNTKMKSFHEDIGNNPGHRVAVPKQYKKEDIHLKQGAILMLHGHVIHGSYANVSKTRSRPMLLIPYITSGEYFIPGKVAQRQEFPLSIFKI